MLNESAASVLLLHPGEAPRTPHSDSRQKRKTRCASLRDVWMFFGNDLPGLGLHCFHVVGCDAGVPSWLLGCATQSCLPRPKLAQACSRSDRQESQSAPRVETSRARSPRPEPSTLDVT